MRRTVPYRRHKRILSIRAKSDIIKNTWNSHSDSEKLLKDPRFIGKLAKGKVHCSCPMCSSKTKDQHGKHINHGWKHSDAKKLVTEE